MSGASFFRPEPDPMARFVRPSCSDCAGPIRWVRLAELVALVRPDQRPRVAEMLDFFDGDPIDAWWCPACGAWGALT